MVTVCKCTLGCKFFGKRHGLYHCSKKDITDPNLTYFRQFEDCEDFEVEDSIQQEQERIKMVIGIMQDRYGKKFWWEEETRTFHYNAEKDDNLVVISQEMMQARQLTLSANINVSIHNQ